MNALSQILAAVTLMASVVIYGTGARKPGGPR